MGSLLKLLLFCSLFVISYSAVFWERRKEIPGHSGECYDNEENKFYKEGEIMKWDGKGCGRRICSRSVGRNFLIEIQTCGTVFAPPDCHIEENLDLPYPECCGVILCNENETQTHELN